MPYPYKGTEHVKQIEIKQERNSKWIACGTFMTESPPYRDNGLYQDIDLGVSNIVSAANLHFKFIQVKNRRADIFWKKKMEQVQSKRDHCKRYSHHWERYNTKLVRMKQKCANQMWDYQHKISKKIVDNTQSQHHYYWRHKREIDGKKTKGNGKPTKNQGS